VSEGTHHLSGLARELRRRAWLRELPREDIRDERFQGGIVGLEHDQTLRAEQFVKETRKRFTDTQAGPVATALIGRAPNVGRVSLAGPH
jgi:hypothetical protein